MIEKQREEDRTRQQGLYQTNYTIILINTHKTYVMRPLPHLKPYFRSFYNRAEGGYTIDRYDNYPLHPMCIDYNNLLFGSNYTSM